MIEKAFWADRREKEKARNPHDSWLFLAGAEGFEPSARGFGVWS